MAMLSMRLAQWQEVNTYECLMCIVYLAKLLSL